LPRLCGRTATDRGRVCTLEQTITFAGELWAYLRSGGDLRLWIPLGILAFAVWGHWLETQTKAREAGADDQV
ncbi:MAG TPA: hypothetical protein VIG68_03090, partial [Lysobacter sp.]